MKQILYESAAHLLRLEYPDSWSAADITDVTLTVTDLSASVLLAADSATIYTADIINGALAAGGDSLALTTGPGAGHTPTEGDRFWIAASAAGPAELVECLYYASGTKTIYLKDDMRWAHTTGASIYGAFCYYELDVSDTGDFPKAKQLVLIWTPDAGGIPITQRAEIAAVAYDTNIEDTFKIRYPREHQVILANNESFGDYMDVVKEELSISLNNRGLQINRVVDQERLKPVTIALCRYMVTLSGGDDWAVEREAAMSEYIRQFEALCSSPLWVDQDQDGAEDEEEVDDYSAWQMINSERGI